MVNREQWNGFKSGNWQASVNVRDVTQCNYTPYDRKRASRIYTLGPDTTFYMVYLHKFLYLV